MYHAEAMFNYRYSKLRHLQKVVMTLDITLHVHVYKKLLSKKIVQCVKYKVCLYRVHLYSTRCREISDYTRIRTGWDRWVLGYFAFLHVSNSVRILDQAHVWDTLFMFQSLDLRIVDFQDRYDIVINSIQHFWSFTVI